MPGTHDAGMSAYNSGTAFTHSCDTVTQTTGILGQLQYGSRYFDIRPVISGGQFMTGHYTDVTQLNSWQGANGQSIQSIIDDVNNYTASNSELVVLYLSHDLNTDLGNSSYAPLTQQEWNTLLTLLQEGINNLFVTSASDLTTLTLNTFIGNNKAAVVVVVDPSGTGISLGNYANQGFYPAASFPVYNQYSDTNTLSTMMADQLAKMRAQKTNLDASYFLLSWTLTQDGTQATFCSAFPSLDPSILSLANTANGALSSNLLPACNANCYPNIIYVDNINSSACATLAMTINGLSNS